MACSVAADEAVLYRDYVNPEWSRLLSVLQMDVRYDHCAGAELFTSDGRRVLDFLSGYCVHNIGHNHPAVVAALHEELDRNGPAMLQSHIPGLAGELAERLLTLAGGKLRKVFFCSSGSEGVEAAIKFSRAATGRQALLYADGAFHGLTCGALSLMGNGFWRERFGAMLPDTESVPFGDLASLENRLSTKRFAAFVVEPLQGEAGVRVPDPQYLHSVQELCRRYGTLLVADEVQTGLYRTGYFLACGRFGVAPDMAILAKALSGGLVPSGAVLMSDAVYEAVYGSIQRSIIHTSTFSENALAMRAGLATIEVLERENLGQRAASGGAHLRDRLQEALRNYEMVKEVRGLGLLCGIEFQAPASMRLRLPFEAFCRIHPAMFGQVLVMRLFRQHNVLTQMCGNHFLTLKVAPPLIAEHRHFEEFVSAIAAVTEEMHTRAAFWTEALGIARRVVKII